MAATDYGLSVLDSSGNLIFSHLWNHYRMVDNLVLAVSSSSSKNYTTGYDPIYDLIVVPIPLLFARYYHKVTVSGKVVSWVYTDRGSAGWINIHTTTNLLVFSK